MAETAPNEDNYTFIQHLVASALKADDNPHRLSDDMINCSADIAELIISFITDQLCTYALTRDKYEKLTVKSKKSTTTHDPINISKVDIQRYLNRFFKTQ